MDRKRRPSSPRTRQPDWRDARLERLEPDHLSVENERPRGRLRSITLRLGIEQIAEARRESELHGVPYQVVLRQWIAQGAAKAQRQRRADRRRPRGPKR